MYTVFHRTWWIRGDKWREPCAGKKYFIGTVKTEEEARTLCTEWNNENAPGELSDKAEYEED